MKVPPIDYGYPDRQGSKTARSIEAAEASTITTLGTSAIIVRLPEYLQRLFLSSGD